MAASKNTNSNTEETSAKTVNAKTSLVVDSAEKEKLKVHQEEPVYTSEELADNAQSLFGTCADGVFAALRKSGKEKFTVSEARGIVENFLKKEVGKNGGNI